MGRKKKPTVAGEAAASVNLDSKTVVIEPVNGTENQLANVAAVIGNPPFDAHAGETVAEPGNDPTKPTFGLAGDDGEHIIISTAAPGGSPGVPNRAVEQACLKAYDNGDRTTLDDVISEVKATAPVTRCKTCGARLINVVTGALCPNGHAGLFPHVSTADNAAAVQECRMASFPQAVQLMSILAEPDKAWVNSTLYRIKGRDGVWRRVKKSAQTLDQQKLPASALLAYDVTQDVVIWLSRFNPAEHEFNDCFQNLVNNANLTAIRAGHFTIEPAIPNLAHDGHGNIVYGSEPAAPGLTRAAAVVERLNSADFRDELLRLRDIVCPEDAASIDRVLGVQPDDAGDPDGYPDKAGVAL